MLELTTKTRCEVRVFATLNPDGSLAVKLAAHAEYAKGMSTSAEITQGDLPAEALEAIKGQLEALFKANEQKLGALIQHSIHESRRVARNHGEIDANFVPVKAATAPTTEAANA